MRQFPKLIKSEPVLAPSQLAFRIGLARKRTASYPLHKLDFILMDLERPECSHRHADWCAGDLTGRVLEFLSAAEGVDGVSDPRLLELFERIIRTRRPSGLLGRLAPAANTSDLPETSLISGAHRLFNGLIKYFELTNDWRGLESAVGLGDWYVAHKDAWLKQYGHWDGCGIEFWITEPLAGLYRLTGEEKYLAMVEAVGGRIKKIEGMHSHGFMTTMRGLQLAALYSGDAAWNERPEFFRRKIIDERYERPDGCVAECFPRSFRNEGCSIADWMMLNLNSALISGEAEGYAKAENILWNALFFNQFITGGFGHRDLADWGYQMGPMSECWWCCLENCGLGMTEYARHAVSLRDDTVWVNLLVPGTFRLKSQDRPQIEVTVSTGYPAVGEAFVRVRNLPGTMAVKLRVPECIRNAKVTETRGANGTELRLKGDVGHWLEPYGDRVLLRYGPVVLAPMFYYWNTENKTIESNVPAGYIPGFLPAGIPRIVPPKTDAKGFLQLAREPIPDWSYFNTGPDEILCVNGASAHVPLKFDGGQEQTLWFAPMCHITSDMSYYDTPILFKS